MDNSLEMEEFKTQQGVSRGTSRLFQCHTWHKRVLFVFGAIKFGRKQRDGADGQTLCTSSESIIARGAVHRFVQIRPFHVFSALTETEAARLVGEVAQGRCRS